VKPFLCVLPFLSNILDHTYWILDIAKEFWQENQLQVKLLQTKYCKELNREIIHNGEMADFFWIDPFLIRNKIA